MSLGIFHYLEDLPAQIVVHQESVLAALLLTVHEVVVNSHPQTGIRALRLFGLELVQLLFRHEKSSCLFGVICFVVSIAG